jgi:hypothetical protein
MEVAQVLLLACLFCCHGVSFTLKLDVQHALRSLSLPGLTWVAVDLFARGFGGLHDGMWLLFCFRIHRAKKADHNRPGDGAAVVVVDGGNSWCFRDRYFGAQVPLQAGWFSAKPEHVRRGGHASRGKRGM